MNKNDQTKREELWSKIESEKKKDSLVRKISVASWVITGAVVLFYGVIVGFKVARVLDEMEIGISTTLDLFSTIMPLVVVMGILSLLVAVLSTIGVFLRMRTSSLQEIQLRLTALEKVILAKEDQNQGG